ncbi:MAG: hypothetical protein HUJ54_15155 [Erysipelotrichaceae bacterium]|nr:hypothetical protein [Erysipelotrichaceae bacterium]
MSKPVIFLDIDGVIHAAGKDSGCWVERREHIAEKLAEQYRNPVYLKLGDNLCSQVLDAFRLEACRDIESLCHEFDASVVISSSWRIFHSLEELQALFQLAGITHVTDVCPKGYVRRDTISRYVKDNRIESYIVIDDMDLKQVFGYRCIHTPSGFEKEHYLKARNALQCQTR